METLKYQVEENRKDIDEVRLEIKEINNKFVEMESRIDLKLEKNQKELMLTIKEQNIESKEKDGKLFNAIDNINNSMNQQQLSMLEMKHELKETKQFMEKVQEKNKWLGRAMITAAIGFAGTFINAMIQTFVF